MDDEGVSLEEQVLNNLPCPVLVIDRRGYLIYFNRASERELGINKEEAAYRPLIDILFQGKKFDRRGRYTSALIETLETGREFSLRLEEIKTGSHMLPKFFLADTSLITNRSKKILGACAVYYNFFQNRNLLKKTISNRLTTISEQFETIYAFAEAIGARDQYTMGHSEKVAEYARMIAEALGLDEKEVDLAYICGIVHDVGKIGVPENILNKAGALSADEFKLITKHPEMGAAILSHISWLGDVVPVVLAHHERFDGKGYPQGLRGEEIPLLSRILAVADAFDAMTSDRRYRPALPLPEAIEELKRNAGSQFDPRVVKAFLRMLGEYSEEEEGRDG
ncbi:HDIG domain-containing protein [Desulfofundulus australicus DSM 11792]|uniref:HDIG domain-containing protein n=1 Tax=Desulfofundulus australicus DSM 11792 TaxID=1121425 RepID=A0A1M4UYG4_9FIRM|nr:HD domain-containing phosphohydrolase [Desulfofundulus australicus]SHE61764.1 HDIG domain-containing protein [Desulfofundulus australicus DSM 11792]